MVWSKLRVIILFVLINLIVAAASFGAGWQMKRMKPDESGVYYTQAMLAFGHYTSYERIKVFLERKCYDAALMDAREMQNLQMVLLADNLRGTGNDPELLEYIKARNPDLLKAILAGKIPELRSYTTTCPGKTMEPDRSNTN